MKTIILFFLLTVTYFAQVNGCVWQNATIDTTGNTNYYWCKHAKEFAYLTVALDNANDTLLIYTGTNLPDSTYDDQVYVLANLIDVTTNAEVDSGVVTGFTTAHTFKINAYKRASIKIYAQAAENGEVYQLEFY